MIERSEKKRPEPSPRSVGRTEGLPPQQAGEKLLRRILRIRRSQTAPPQLRIHRRPVTTAQRLNRARSVTPTVRLRENAPVRTGKTRVRVRTELRSFTTHLDTKGSISSHPAQAPANHSPMRLTGKLPQFLSPWVAFFDHWREFSPLWRLLCPDRR